MHFFVKAFARYPPFSFPSFRDSLIQLVQFSPHCTLKSRGDSVVHTHRLCRIKLARGEVTLAFRYVRPNCARSYLGLGLAFWEQARTCPIDNLISHESSSEIKLRSCGSAVSEFVPIGISTWRAVRTAGTVACAQTLRSSDCSWLCDCICVGK